MGHPAMIKAKQIRLISAILQYYKTTNAIVCYLSVYITCIYIICLNYGFDVPILEPRGHT